MPGVVAVAGGTTGVGAAIVDALVENGAEFIVLSRRPAADGRTRAVDYQDVAGLQRVLEQHRVDTVVCATAIQDDDAGQAQMNLIAAADRAECTRRFMPSEFGMLYNESNIAHVPAYAWKLRAAEALEASGLEYTLVSIGLFLDYWAAPRIPTRLTSAPPLFLDLAQRFAAVPGDGGAPLVLTHSRDAGRFAAALLLRAPGRRWAPRHTVAGDRLTLRDAVAVAEAVLGGPLDVRHDPPARLREGRATLTPTLAALVRGTPAEAPTVAMVAQTGLNMLAGELDLPMQNNLVDMFPDIKPLTVRDVAEAWR